MANSSCQTFQFIICHGIPEAVTYIGLLRYCRYNKRTGRDLTLKQTKRMDNWLMRLLQNYWAGIPIDLETERNNLHSTDLCTVGRLRWFFTFFKVSQAWYFKPWFSAFISMNKTQNIQFFGTNFKSLYSQTRWLSMWISQSWSKYTRSRSLVIRSIVKPEKRGVHTVYPLNCINFP